MTARASRSGRSEADLGFASRLAELCARDGQPAHGRQRWLIEQLSGRGIPVSRESVSKWFAGTVPSDEKMHAIAAIFQVDPGWLRYGAPRRGSSRDRDRQQATLAPMTFEAASRQLALVVDNAVRGEPTVIDRDGVAQAVVVGFREWQRLSAPSLGRLLMTAPSAGEDLSQRSSVPLRSIDL